MFEFITCINHLSRLTIGARTKTSIQKSREVRLVILVSTNQRHFDNSRFYNSLQLKNTQTSREIQQYVFDRSACQVTDFKQCVQR
jgi:hypothetical protein